MTRIYICHSAHRIVSSSPLESCPAEFRGVAPGAVVVCRADLHGPFIDMEDHEDAVAAARAVIADLFRRSVELEALLTTRRVNSNQPRRADA